MGDITNTDADPESQEDETVAALVDDESSAATDEEPTGPKPEWYVVHSYSGKENKVKKNLEHRAESMNMTDRSPADSCTTEPKSRSKMVSVARLNARFSLAIFSSR